MTAVLHRLPREDVEPPPQGGDSKAAWAQTWATFSGCPCWSRSWTRWPSGVPSYLNHSVNLGFTIQIFTEKNILKCSMGYKYLFNHFLSKGLLLSRSLVLVRMILKEKILFFSHYICAFPVYPSRGLNMNFSKNRHSFSLWGDNKRMKRNNPVCLVLYPFFCDTTGKSCSNHQKTLGSWKVCK